MRKSLIERDKKIGEIRDSNKELIEINNILKQRLN